MKSREATSSTDALSSENESTPEEDDLQLQSLLAQSRCNLERTEALRIRSHLLRQEDYVSPFRIVTCGILSFIRAAVLGTDDQPWWPIPQQGYPAAAVLSRPILGIIVFLSAILLLRRWLE